MKLVDRWRDRHGLPIIHSFYALLCKQRYKTLKILLQNRVIKFWDTKIHGVKDVPLGLLCLWSICISPLHVVLLFANSYYQQPLYTVQNLIQIQIRILLVHHTHFSYPRAIIDDFPVTLIEITTYLLSPF